MPIHRWSGSNPRESDDSFMIILGIESSCDETAAAVVEDGTRVLSSIVSSQVKIHHKYGGVVPELASRKHVEAVVPVVSSAIREAGIEMDALDGVAATQGPGLVGALLIGFSFAKSFAFARNIPWVGVNHLEGHINSVFLGEDPPDFPFVALMVSGGHTNIYHVTSHTEYELMGQTRDDAVGEAYDKVSKMLGLGYPGGLVLDRLAGDGDPKKIDFPRSWLEKSGFDFSFSGLKSAVNRCIQLHGDEYSQADIAASFQESVVDVLSYKIISAAKRKRVKNLAVVGGVAANSRLRQRVTAEAKKRGMKVHIPAVDLCGDNAAMIAARGYHHLKAGDESPLTADVYSRPKVTTGFPHK